MKIAFLGNFAVDFTSESHYAKTLESMGHTVHKLQEPMNTDVIHNVAKNSDVFIWVHTHGWANRGSQTMLDVLRALKDIGVPTVAYHLDLYMPIARWKDYENSDYMQVEHFFTVDKLMANWLNENTATKGHYLPAGVFDQECYTEAPVKHPLFETVFVGSKSYHPEWSYRPQLINWLHDTYGDRFAHYGNDGKRVVRGAALNRLYSDAKIVIGDSLSVNFDYPYYWSDRIYETTGRGGFIIHPYIKGLETQFEDGKEVVFYEFNNFDDLKQKIDYYLVHDDEREQIRLAGHKRTKADHTYKNRWQTILETVK